MNKKHWLLAIAFFTLLNINAQDDLLDELNEETKGTQQFELPAFKAMQIGNLQSTKIADKGDLYMIVAHRFGTLQNGIEDFFGLDEANTRIQLAYGFWDGVQLSFGRDSFEKTYSTSIKARFVKQSNAFPFNLVGYASADANTLLQKSTYPFLKFGDRMSYTLQLLASSRINKNLSLQFAPIFLRQNLQEYALTGGATHNQFIMGLGGRVKVSKRMSINLDYGLNLSRHKNSVFHDPLTVGVDIETGGHVFQLLFTNARGSNDSAFLGRTAGDFFGGDISFGFNIVRVF